MSRALIALAGTAIALASASASGQTVPARMVFFSRSWTLQPAESTWSGSAWSSPTVLSAMTDEPQWVKVRACPTRNEVAIITQDYSDDAYVWFKINGTYGTPTRVSTNVGSSARGAVAVAYEQLSGDALFVYENNSASSTPFRTASSGSLSSQSTIANFGTSALCRVINLYARPASDQILALGVNGNADLFASRWSGTGWGAASTLTTTAAQDDLECFAAAWLPSGDALVAYARSGFNGPTVRTLSGTTWSSETNVGTHSATLNIIRMAVNPSTGTVVLAALDANSAVVRYTRVGTTWSSASLVASSVGTSLFRVFDVAWTPDGTQCLLVYAKNSDRVYARTFDGTTWSSEITGPALRSANKVKVVQLTPGSSGKEIFVLASNENIDLWAMRWDGSTLGTGSLVQNPLGGDVGDEPFGVSDAGGSNRMIIKSWTQVEP